MRGDFVHSEQATRLQSRVAGACGETISLRRGASTANFVFSPQKA
jgi:hypothetical protein